MICQECGERPATLCFTKDGNEESIEFHICEPCAREKGYPIPKTTHEPSSDNLWEVESHSDSSVSDEGAEQNSECEKCGLTYEEFNRTGRFGCNECFKQFAEHLPSLFRHIHVTTATHSGKIPKRNREWIQNKNQLELLKEQLQHFIEQEKYEQAAALRDQIQELERKVSEQS